MSGAEGKLFFLFLYLTVHIYQLFCSYLKLHTQLYSCHVSIEFTILVLNSIKKYNETLSQ